MATNSALSGPPLQASRAALSAALAEHSIPSQRTEEELIEAGEIQVVDMQGQAEAIKTVFSDPNNFNVKVNPSLIGLYLTILTGVVASSLFALDTVV